ncbi:glycosyltransferase [Actinomadura madurae]|uniref:Glycosyltransferase involved in cell wall bisynthesis n=1 Tax=Actinomadura madurae TaxID=1993 RepID=A0A1I5HL14_9ACTN|nr:glycosyltransferase [Actinomadura madurae]SFO48965.1 Glycosyltransferase involved in cell wall bisynthesis [Actinomadura madurae]SPT57824.1 D-inositol-3-phosphate glycosyltransferase [Actinomadura madurae]
MRIAMISEHASPLAADGGLGGADGGGQNVFVAELATELGRQGHDVTVYTRRDSRDLPERVRLAPGATVEHVPAGPPEHVAKDDLLPWMRDFGTYLERRWAADPPDVAHAHFWMSGLAAIQAAQPAGARRVPVVQTYHALGTVKRRHQGGGDTSPASRIRLERAIGRGADSVIATCSDEVAELAAMGVPRDRVRVVPCGVDLDLFTPEGPASGEGGRHRLVVLSRLVERKGVDTAIRALAHLPDAVLTIAGGPPHGELNRDPEVRRLRKVARNAGVSSRVEFLGRLGRDAVPPLLRSASLVVTLPWYEPFGMVPLEAMACGVPVVASAVGGHLDTVADGVTGALVPPRDPEGAAAAIRALLDDPAARAAMGFASAGRARERYSWARVAAGTAEVYQRAAALSGVAA